MPSIRHQLRDWQHRAFLAWQREKCRGIVSVVTGGGKTTFALHCLDYYRKNIPASTALIIVPTSALLDQWLEEIISFFDIPLSHISILKNCSGIRLSRINIGIINTVAALADSPPKDPLFLIVDECHRSSSEFFKRIYSIPTDASLGLSATPERQYDNGLQDVIVPNLGPIIFRYDYKDALTDGIIVPFSLKNILFSFEEGELVLYNKLTKAIGIAVKKYGYDSPEAVRLMLKRARISNLSLARIKIAVKLVARHKQNRILLFHEDINACDLIQRILNENKIPSALYHSKIPLIKRVQNLQAYRRGEVRVLVTCRALDEGFNVPETEIGIIAAATATYRQRIQRLGRVLRPAKGKTNALIYSIIASDPEIRRLAEEANDLKDIAEVTWIRE